MQLIENPDDIKLNRDDDVQALLGDPPGWFLRWGITVVAFTTVMLLVLSWVVRYPDIVVAPISLLTEQPAIRVHAQRSAKLDQLLVRDKQEVTAGALIAVLDNAAKLEAVRQLKTFVEQSDKGLEMDDIIDLQPPNLEQLGILEGPYAEFRQLWKDYQRFVKRSSTFAKIRSLRKQIEQMTELNNNLEQQVATLNEELSIVKNKQDRLQQLYQSGNIALQDVEDVQAIYLQVKRQLENQRSMIINNKVRSQQLQVEVIDLKQNRRDGTSTRQLAVQESIQRLQGLISQWEQNNLIYASIGGIVSMPRPLNEREFVQENQALLAIVPQQEAGEVIGKAMLPLQGSGKVEIGQRVNIRLEAYPFQEFGVVKGEVKKKSILPENNQILVEIVLTDGLNTTYNLPIDFTQEMQGTAQIITEDRRFISRVMDRVLSVVRNR